MSAEREATLAQARIVAQAILNHYTEKEYQNFLPANWILDTITAKQILWQIAYSCEKRLSYQFMDNLTNNWPWAIVNATQRMYMSN